MPEEVPKQHQLYEEIRAVVGSDHVTVEDYARRSYTRAPFYSLGGGGRGKTPGIVVRPGSSEEVAAVVKLANRTRTPIVPKGGGGSICTFPPLHVGDQTNILIDTQRLNRIIDIDTTYMTVRAETGVILSQLADVVSKQGFHLYTVDVPIHMDTLGGMLSGFIGGGEPSDLATVGTINNYLLGLKVVLPSGEILETGGGPGTNIHQPRCLHREAGSPDMTGMFLGDGGSFGIKTEATLTIHPYPKVFELGITDMGSRENMWDAFRDLAATDPYPYTRLLSFHNQGDPWYFVHVIRAHTGQEAEVKRNILAKICAAHGGKPAEVGQEILQFANMFSARRLGQQALPMGSTMTYFGEALIPMPHSLEYVDDLNAVLDETVGDLDVYRRVDFVVPYLRATSISGILLYFGKGTTRDEASSRLSEKAQPIMEKLFTKKYGGWTETQQGTSMIHSATYWSPAYRNFMRTIKNALDPNNIMMPGLWRI